MLEFGHALEKIIGSVVNLKQVCKADLQYGDMVFIVTYNSVYLINILENETYLVSGGWFDRKGQSPQKTNITGCSWGSNVIKVDILAACGMRLEFGNGVLTTPIQKIIVLPFNSKN